MSPSWTCADSVGLGVQRQANRKASRTQDFAISDHMDLHSSCVSRPSKPPTVGCVTPCAPTSLRCYNNKHHVSLVNCANFTRLPHQNLGEVFDNRRRSIHLNGRDRCSHAIVSMSLLLCRPLYTTLRALSLASICVSFLCLKALQTSSLFATKAIFLDHSRTVGKVSTCIH